MSTNKQRGFTLVELAIVMTIIGLLIGGILKGQEMIQNARVTATIAQVKAIEAATTTFSDAYAGLPGDLAGAQTRVPGCTDFCFLDPTAATNGAGDGRVGDADWGGTGPTDNAFDTNSQNGISLGNTGNGAYDEPVLFWQELSAASLLSGITTNALTGASTTPAWGDTHPAAKIGGGFLAGYSKGGYLPGTQNGSTPGTVSGTVLLLINQPTSNLGTSSTSASTVSPITATKAAQIDRKMDDGVAYTGSVQAYGATATLTPTPTGCADQTAATPLNYQERSTSNTCGLVFKIQG